MDPRSCAASDVTHQLQLAHVLLDGGYEGVATLAEALAGGDHGLGTVDRLDGELVVVDGEPWRVDWHGVAELLPLDTRTPFVVVSTLDSPRTVRLRDCGRDAVAAAIEALVDDPGAVVSVRLEGEFTSVLVRSVPPQDPPYRPYVEVCASDEVRWTYEPFSGVFVGFRFPDLEAGSTIPGLHLHGVDRLRTIGGHNHDLRVLDAVLSVGVSHDVMLHLPEHDMTDLLEMAPTMRAVQRQLLRSGPDTIAGVALGLGIPHADAQSRIEWLAERGFVIDGPSSGNDSGAGAEPRWRVSLRASGSGSSGRVADVLESLYARSPDHPEAPGA
jgi:acetolactate decarboxylase